MPHSFVTFNPKTKQAHRITLMPYAYHQGRRASIAHDSDPRQCPNPYLEYTAQWYSWNRGWNSDDPDERS